MQLEKGNHFEHLDGLRGLTALYVVIYHANGTFNNVNAADSGPGIPAWLRHGLGLISFGQSAVAIFIVLSGYCLMLPVIKTADGKLRGGTVEYFKRRAKRILPPYYAALVGSLLLIAFVPGINRPHPGWGIALPAFNRDVLLSHLLLIHNTDVNWAYKIDYPMWSVATEWQIYFCFPFALLPLWRRCGTTVVVGAAVIGGMVPHWLFRGRVDVAAFEFVGLFAFGMAAAEFSFAEGGIGAGRTRAWGVACIALLVPIALLAKFRGNWDWWHSAGNNILVGMAASCFLVYCARSLALQPRPSLAWAVRLLRWRPCLLLGTFSYSLYLIHAPVIAMAAIELPRFHASPSVTIITAMCASVSLSIVAAYVFFLAFERPFLVKRQKASIVQVAREAVLSPAP